MLHNATSWLRRLGGHFREWLLGVPVFVKVMGIALGMAVVLAAGMLWQIHRTWHSHLLRDLEQRGQRIANQLAAHCADLSGAGLAADIPAELKHSLSESPEMAYAVLQHTNGVILASAREIRAAPEAHNHGKPISRAEARAAENVVGGAQIRELTAKLGRGPHELRVGMSTAQVDAEVGWLTRRLARVTAMIALVGMALAWGLTRVFAHPIQELVTLTRNVKAGQFDTKAPVRARDEVGELATAFNEMTEALAHKEAARQQLLRRVIRAGEEERKRIARELHDETGQALTSQIAGLSALEYQAADAGLRRRLSELRHQAEQTLTEVHDLSVTLRPSVLDDVGLVAAVQRHCRTFAQRSGVTVNCADAGLDTQRLPAEVELTIYRVVQEALTNAVRHGRATRIQVLAQRTKTGVLASIQDNGSGFDSNDWQQRCVEGNHLGLLGIEERVTLLNGSFRVESEPGKGATVYADIPLKEAV